MPKTTSPSATHPGPFAAGPVDPPSSESANAAPIPANVAPGSAIAARSGGWRTVLIGPADDPRWARPALLALLLATAGLYLWNLTSSGYANSFYSAAVQAGSASWKAFFFGSSDAANSITVDKPPAALWAMALSVRVFGLSSFAILMPQVLMGVATVGTVYACVKRYFTPAAGLIAGLVMALTPVAVLMFRFNNPDALLVLLMTLGAYATMRAIEHGSVRWMALTGALLGLGFLTKTLQVFLVIPFLGLAYLICADTTLRRRIAGSAAATAAMTITGGWWVAIVELMPASLRPYIGGSQDNSFLSLTFGYNGLGRLNGEETGSVGGGGFGGAGGSMWGSTGLLRLFGTENGGQADWLIPSALILTVAALIIRGRKARTDTRRAAYIVWGGWLLVTFLTFSFMAGIFHAYYTVALAPAIAALIGMGAVEAWERRATWLGAAALAAATAAAAGWSFVLLSRTTAYGSWLRIGILIIGLAAAVLLLSGRRLPARIVPGLIGAGLIAGLAGPAAYSLTTVSTGHTGSIVTAGPSTGGFGGFGGGMRGGGMRTGGAPAGGMPAGRMAPGSMPPGGTAPGGTAPGGTAPGGTAPGGTAPGGATTDGSAAGAMPPGEFGGRARGGFGGGASGLLNASTPSTEIVAALSTNADQYTWVAAAVGSQSAAGLQLGSQLPVMAIGGFNGSDPSPTLAQFQGYVESGQIHYFLAGGGFGQSNGGSSSSSEISTWVAQTFTSVTIDGQTFYDLTKPVS